MSNMDIALVVMGCIEAGMLVAVGVVLRLAIPHPHSFDNLQNPWCSSSPSNGWTINARRANAA